MSAGLAVIVIAILACLASLAVSGFMVAAGVGDVPNARSAHSKVTPRAGGLGVVAGLGLSLLSLTFLLPEYNVPTLLGPFLSLLFGVSVVGLIDDTHGLSPSLKLLILLFLCGALVWVLGPVTYLPAGEASIALPYIVGFVGTVLWMFTVPNIVNFMDGSNGMIGLSMALASLALIGIGFVAQAPVGALLALLLLASILGFLPYNLRRNAKIFLGDIGSLTIGFFYAGIVIFMLNEAQGMSVIYAGPLLILPFLTDTLLTMLRRAVKGHKIWQAHNLHIYQRSLRAGKSHIVMAWRYGLLTLLCGNLAIYGAQEGQLNSPWIIIVPTLLLSGLYVAMSKRLPD